MHAQRLSSIIDGSPVLVDQLVGVVDLRRGESRAWAKLHASRFGRIPPALGTVDDQLTLELGKDGQDHTACRLVVPAHGSARLRRRALMP